MSLGCIVLGCLSFQTVFITLMYGVPQSLREAREELTELVLSFHRVGPET